MRRVSLDVECNGFSPSRIWCVGVQDLDTGEEKLFKEEDMFTFKKYIRDAEEIIGHNIIQFDLYVLDKLWKFTPDISKITDTLILSQLEKSRRD